MVPKRAPEILFLNQTGDLGGGELSLFHEVINAPYAPTVLLFQNGPLTAMLAARNIPVVVLQSGASALAVRRRSGVLAGIRALPGVVALVWAVAQHMRGFKITVANSQKAFVVGVLAARLTRRKLVWQLRDLISAAHFSKPIRRLVIFLANHGAVAVITNSQASRLAFIAEGGRPELISVVYPGVDAHEFNAVSAHQIASLRAQFTTSQPGTYPPIVGIFGRLAAWKGQLVFIDALAMLPGCIGVIVGGPLFGEEAFEQELHQRIAKHGIQHRVHMLGFREDIPALMKAMDIIVHASTAPEPFGRVIVEGMLAGKPVIASRSGGAMEIIEHGKTGYLTQPGDITELASAIQNIITTPDTAATIAAAGQAHASEVFTVQATSEKFGNLIKSLV